MTQFLVQRYEDEKLAKSYGPFEDRELADRVAQLAAEKHLDLVIVVPIEVKS
jgi:hypothetical protein